MELGAEAAASLRSQNVRTSQQNSERKAQRQGQFAIDDDTVRDFALEIAYKKFTGDFWLDFLNQVGARQGSDF